MIACVSSGVVLGVKWLREGRLPIFGGGGVPTVYPGGSDGTLTPTPSPTSTPTITPLAVLPVLPPTSTLSAAPPTATLTTTLLATTPTVTPTAVVTPTAEAGVVDVTVELAASSQTVQIAEAATFTVTVVNTGEVALGRLRYSLEGPWDELLVTADPTGLLVVEDEEVLEAGGQREVVFRLEGRRMGLANVWAGVTFEVQAAAPYLDRRISSSIPIMIMP